MPPRQRRRIAMSHEHAPDVEDVTDDIDHVLGHSWFFDPQSIKVAVADGKVTLTGSVRSQRERRMAAAAAWAHEGVSEVENHLVVVEK
jgi:osmotically-inducible protein OsmY